MHNIKSFDVLLEYRQTYINSLKVCYIFYYLFVIVSQYGKFYNMGKNVRERES